MTRIPLSIKSGRLVLVCVIECRSLRIQKQITSFILDTGSSDSLISTKDAIKMQIPLSGKTSSGDIDFGGSRFEKIDLQEFTMYALKENSKISEHITLKINLSALRSNKKSEKKIQVAESLPSILGMDFLKEQNLSLHVILRENIAYLETYD